MNKWQRFGLMWILLGMFGLQNRLINGTEIDFTTYVQLALFLIGFVTFWFTDSKEDK